MPSVFVEYSRAIERLHSAPPEAALRRFELVLLSEMGYRINLLTDEHGESIRPLVHYRFEVERGFCVSDDRLLTPRPNVMTGEQIHRTTRGWKRVHNSRRPMRRHSNRSPEWHYLGLPLGAGCTHGN
ncbi:MAG: hypothetical protein CM15mP84_06850 [Cellvibrionales bacterium]|nr:MAG: hypothetical protein CM15mP84_06850 [Cellvibrionales bacterium]